MEGGHEGGSSREPLLLRAHSNKVRWRQPAAVLGAELHEGVSDGELLSAEQRELRGAEQLEHQAQLASLAEAQELQPILSSFSAPLLASVPGIPLALVASEAPRRPNPWELSNKKTFKPIITIGKTGGGAPPLAAKRRQLFSLPFAQQRRMPSLPPPRRVSTTPPLCAAEGLPSLRCGTLCLGAAIDVKEVYTHYSRQELACTAYKDGLNVVVHCQHRADDKGGDAHAFYFMCAQSSTAASSMAAAARAHPGTAAPRSAPAARG